MLIPVSCEVVGFPVFFFLYDNAVLLFMILLTFSGCFCCAMETGVRIYNVEPLMEKGHLGKM